MRGESSQVLLSDTHEGRLPLHYLDIRSGFHVPQVQGYDV
jgi:hypothetical protein